MLKRSAFPALTLALVAGSLPAQRRLPPASEIAKLGVDADPTTRQRGGSARRRPAEMLPIPEVEDLMRVSRDKRPTRDVARISAFVLKTERHPVAGDAYVVLTDHVDEPWLKPLRRLVAQRKGVLIQVNDLATLHRDAQRFEQVRKQLVDANAKFVAIAPRLDSFRENMLLGTWKLLATIDDDPKVDAFPGLLLASSPAAFDRLVRQSIEYRPRARNAVRPIAISQVQSAAELRSLQKAAILRKLFARMQVDTPIVAVYGEQAANAPRLEGEKIWNLTVKKREFIEAFPEDVAKELDAANLIVMHGHGIPGMSCSVDNRGLPANLGNKIVFTGSCFSAAPVASDLPRMTRAPGGYDVEQRGAFLLQAIDNGAVVAFGHQRLSSGFPHLFPVLEDVLDGKTVGEAYQRLLNGLIEIDAMTPERMVITRPQSRRVPQNGLLYVLIGDPAVRLFERRSTTR